MMINPIRFYLFLICLLLSGCKKYLEKNPDDLNTPVNVADYTAILNGEGWNKVLDDDSRSLYFPDMMTDDVEEYAIKTYGIIDQKMAYSAFYTWQNHCDFQYDYRNTPSSMLNDTWIGLYRIIQVCNVIINAGNKIEGNAKDRQYLLGEAYFSRALAYFFLVNIWGTPYSPGNPADSMGVPLNITGTIDKIALPRASVTKVYDQIIQDLSAALEANKASGKETNIFHSSPAAIYLLLSRIYLYLQNWQQAAYTASLCLELKPTLTNLESKNYTIKDYYNDFFTADNPEVIFSFFNKPDVYFSGIYGYGYGYGYQASSSLVQLYDTTDYRLNAFFVKIILDSTNNFTIIPKTIFSGPFTESAYSFALRNAEAYLNRAEANAHLGNLSDALSDLNLLRSKRQKNATSINISEKDTLISFILQERRRELPFQLHRWFDLRRTDRPAIMHAYTPIKEDTVQPTEKFLLRKDDPGYMLEIPLQALQANPLLRPAGLPSREHSP